jgi:parallel beta-helix repeat protein
MNVFSKTGIFLILNVLLCMFAGLPSVRASPNPTAYDFDGDGKADIVWRNSSTGIVSVWLMNGETIASNGLLATIPSEWQIAGMGDVNADNRADIIWRNSTSGVVAVWMMDGLTITSAGFPGSASMEWAIHAVGDMNGDAKTDLVWRNTNTGEVSIWLMNGTRIASSGIPSGVPLDWQIVGMADMNADGKGDVIWRNGTTGAIAVWLMNGLNITSTGFPGSTTPDWEIAGIGDVDGDGKSDLIWRNISSGAVSVWLMNGISLASSGFLDGVPTNWVIAQVGDTDADGNADIIWRNSTTGVVSVWRMKGLAITSVGYPGAIETGTSSSRGSRGDGNVVPKLLTPTGGSTLPGSSVTFTWTENGAALSAWGLRIGASQGDASFYDSGNLSSGTLARTVSGLPTNGFPVWVRLQWRYTDGSWSSTDVQYKGGTGTGGTSPSNPSPTPSTPTAPSPSTPSPSGSVFYVSTSGNDANPGTQSSPLRTIKRGLGVLKAGNTLFIRGGTYSEILQTHTGTKFPVGTSWNTPVTVAAYTGETVILRGAIDIGIASPPTQYVIFDGINIDATNEESGLALTGGSHHIRFQNFEIKNPQVNGIQLTWHNGGSTYNEFRNCHIHDTGKSGKGHGIYIETSNNLIDGCDLHDNYRYGLQIYDGYNQASNFNIIRNNHVHQNGLLQAHSGGITIGGDGNLIENNRVHDNPWGISVLSGSPRNTKVRNNTVWNHPGAGVVIGGINTTLENNTAYNNSPDYQYP